ncbi:hypothetical protein NIES2107_44020 [Nostoc carneum NIES-2107]|nr:hypothetical protein NIES2107_44020 [Nostoc carneum NIES-2107]
MFLKEVDIKITLGRIASKFMADIQVAIEGEDAIAATEELLAIPGISGDYTVNTEAPERETVVATVATIVGIVGGAIAIAEQIRKWYQEYQGKQSGKRIEKVLIVGRNGRRLLLKNPTVEEIRQILEP